MVNGSVQQVEYVVQTRVPICSTPLLALCEDGSAT